MSGAPPEPAPKHSTHAPPGHRRHVGRRGRRGRRGFRRSSRDRGHPAEAPAAFAGQLTPNDGSWQRVAASSDVPDGRMHPFDLGSVSGFVRRVDGKPEAVSGVCTHQGCRLWFDAPDDRLRCPCHSTSFSPTGQVLTHQLPIAPKPLPTLMVREVDGVDRGVRAAATPTNRPSGVTHRPISWHVNRPCFENVRLPCWARQCAVAGRMLGLAARRAAVGNLRIRRSTPDAGHDGCRRRRTAAQRRRGGR